MQVIDEAVLLRYKQRIVEDYAAFYGRISSNSANDIAAINKFQKSINLRLGKKYIKVVTNGSVHSFIVATKDDRFPYGTILKAANRNAPAKNFSRGSIFGDLSRVRWTGAA